MRIRWSWRGETSGRDREIGTRLVYIYVNTPGCDMEISTILVYIYVKTSRPLGVIGRLVQYSIRDFCSCNIMKYPNCFQFVVVGEVDRG